MHAYRRLAELEPVVRRRTFERLLTLRKELGRRVQRRSQHQLLLATRNVREFDSPVYGDDASRTNIRVLKLLAENLVDLKDADLKRLCDTLVR